MSLKEKLEAQKKKFLGMAPPEAVQVMGKATEELRASGIMDRALSKGGTMPVFTLENQTGESVSSADLLAKGPLVLSFYRGKW